jgi:hypothetical protein
MRLTRFSSLVLAVFAVALGASAQAEAQSLSSCGDVYVPGRADCTVVPPSAGCELNCTPVSLEASCAAELYVDCRGQCNADIDVGCTGSCQADCMADCTVDPGKLDCSVNCQAGCAADCDARCTVSSDVHCRASCKASCSGSCNASCKSTPPSASCDAKCSASCKGECKAKANVDCNVQCQSGGYLKCNADLKGGCEAACKAKEGALFCEGQFIETNSLDQCVAALKGALDVQVSGYATGDAACDGGTCNVEAEAGAGCSVSPRPARHDALGLVLGLSALGAAFAVRRAGRRSRRS